MWLDSKALLNQTAHKWILLVADAWGTLVWGKATLASHQSAHFLTQTSHKYNSHVNKHRLINKHANEIFLPFHGLLYLYELRYRDSWLARKGQNRCLFEIVIGHLIAAQAVLFSTSPWPILASGCQETGMIKWWCCWFCPPALYACHGEEGFLPSWPVADHPKIQFIYIY